MKGPSKKAAKSSPKKLVVKNRKDGQQQRPVSPECGQGTSYSKNTINSSRSKEHRAVASRYRGSNGAVETLTALEEANEISETALPVTSRTKLQAVDTEHLFSSNDDPSYNTRRSKRRVDDSVDERNVKRSFQFSECTQSHSKDAGGSLSPHHHFDGTPRSHISAAQNSPPPDGSFTGRGKSSQSSGTTADIAAELNSGQHSQSSAAVMPSYCSFFAGEGPDIASRSQGDSQNGDKAASGGGSADSLRTAGKAPNQTSQEFASGMPIGPPGPGYYPGPYWVSVLRTRLDAGCSFP